MFVNPDRPIWELTIASEDGSVDVHRTTDDHPYWVKGMGWLPVAQLSAGMQLSTGDGHTLQLVEVRVTGKVETTYNIEVADWHTFLVGHQRVLAHNCAKKVDNAVDLARKATKVVKDLRKARPDLCKVGKWVGFADAAEEALKGAGLPGRRVRIENAGVIVSDGVNVTENGVHEFIDVGGKVFDNLSTKSRSEI